MQRRWRRYDDLDLYNDLGRAVTHYEILNVAPTAPTVEIRRAYLALARLHHPDRLGGDTTKMRALNEAWTTLGDPNRRARYDLTLSQPIVAVDDEPAPPFRSEEADLLADLADDTPLGGRVVLPRWLSLVPVAVFASSVGVFWLGLLFAATPALAAAAVLFLLSCSLFLAAPFVALLSSRRRMADRTPSADR